MLLDTNTCAVHWTLASVSHSPILDYLSGRLRIESINEAEADDTTNEMLRSGNAKRILGINYVFNNL